MGTYAESMAKAESRYSGADGEKQYTVLKDFTAMKIMPVGVGIKTVGNVLGAKAFKAGEIVTVGQATAPKLTEVSIGVKQKMQEAAPTQLVNAIITPDGNYYMPSPEFLKEGVPATAAEKAADTTAPAKFFLGMTKTTTIIVGLSVLALGVGGFIYYKKFYKK